MQDDLAFVDDFFPATFTIDAHARAAGDCLDGHGQRDRLDVQQLIVGHGLVGAQLREVVAGFAVRVGKGSMTHIRLGGDAKRPLGFHIHEGRGDLAVVFDPHSAMSHCTARGGFDAVGETAVAFEDDEQALVFAREVQPQRGRARQPDARAENLPRAEMGMTRRADFQDFIESLHGASFQKDLVNFFSTLLKKYRGWRWHEWHGTTNLEVIKTPNYIVSIIPRAVIGHAQANMFEGDITFKACKVLPVMPFGGIERADNSLPADKHQVQVNGIGGGCISSLTSIEVVFQENAIAAQHTLHTISPT